MAFWRRFGEKKTSKKHPKEIEKEKKTNVEILLLMLMQMILLTKTNSIRLNKK